MLSLFPVLTGTCHCGRCKCDNLEGNGLIHGKYCECDDRECIDEETGEMCTGKCIYGDGELLQVLIK